MNNYYRLVSDGVGESPRTARWHCSGEDVDKGNVAGTEEPYRRGVLLESPRPLKIVTLRPGIITDMDVIWSGVPVVSQRAHEAIKDLVADCVQAIPILLEATGESWWVYNVLRLSDCMDEKRSDYTAAKKGTRRYEMGRYDVVTIPIIRRSAAPSSCLFRLQRWPITLFASHALLQRVRDAKLRGWYFHPVEDSE